MGAGGFGVGRGLQGQVLLWTFGDFNCASSPLHVIFISRCCDRAQVHRERGCVHALVSILTAGLSDLVRQVCQSMTSPSKLPVTATVRLPPASSVAATADPVVNDA